MNSRAAQRPDEGDHDHSLDVSEESAPNYLRWIAELCSPYLGRSVLEIGSGHGTVTQYLAQGREHLVATDVSPECVARLATRFASTANVSVQFADLRDLQITETFDSVVMINVLEHIYDDAGALATLRDRLNPGGSIVVYVPAVDRLYGGWDRKVGHFRRYGRKHLAAVVREAGLVADPIRYVNLLAIPAWMAFSTLGGGKDARVGRNLNIWDRTAVPFTRALESRVRMPIGLNLFCVARRT